MPLLFEIMEVQTNIIDSVFTKHNGRLTKQYWANVFLFMFGKPFRKRFSHNVWEQEISIIKLYIRFPLIKF